MKRKAYLSLFITVLLTAVILLSACRSAKQGEQNAPPPASDDAAGKNYDLIVGESGADVEGISLLLVSFNLTGENPRIEATWRNNTDNTVIYGKSYDIEKQVDGEWVTCAVSDLAFPEVACLLEPHSDNLEIYSPEQFDMSSPGSYRLITECHVHVSEDETLPCKVWAEFAIKSASCEFSAQYIRTDGYHEDVEYPVVKIIRSVQELNAYYQENKDRYSLERKSEVYSDTAIGFMDACDRYDAAYFEDQILVLVLLQEGSGSVRHEVTDITATNDGKLAIAIDVMPPEAGTCDMAQWHIMIEPEAGVDVTSEADVEISLNHGGPIVYPSYTDEYGYMIFCPVEYKEYSFEELAAQSHAVICGDVVQTAEYPAGNNGIVSVVQYVSIEVRSVLKGNAAVGETLNVFENGCITFDLNNQPSGGVTLSGDPFMKKGNRVLLFLTNGEQVAKDGKLIYTITVPSIGKLFYDSDGAYHSSLLYSDAYCTGKVGGRVLADMEPKTLDEIAVLIDG